MAEAIEVTYTIVDEKKDRSTVSVRLLSTTAFDEAQKYAADFATLLDAVIDGVIERIGMSFTVVAPGGLKVAAAGQTDVEHGATFIYNSNGPERFQHRIPTFKQSLIGIGSADVDQTKQPVIDLINEMVNGHVPLLVNVQPTSWLDSDILALSSARQTFTKTRR